MEKVKIVEVGPRDGLQNIKEPISLANKISYIQMLAAAGLEEIEFGSFVNPKWVPQMAGSEDVYAAIKNLASASLDLTALVPNERGLARAQALGVNKIAVFTAVTESFNQKNTACSQKESLERIKILLPGARQSGMKIRAYISTAFDCPYEGNVTPQKTVALVDTLHALGLFDISIGDTTGKATPDQVEKLVTLLKSRPHFDGIAMHFHNTHGTSLANVKKSLALGIRIFDGSAGGMGGCPYAPGATGNVATEALVALVHAEGFATGVNEKKLAEAAFFIKNILGQK